MTFCRMFVLCQDTRKYFSINIQSLLRAPFKINKVAKESKKINTNSFFEFDVEDFCASCKVISQNNMYHSILMLCVFTIFHIEYDRRKG